MPVGPPLGEDLRAALVERAHRGRADQLARLPGLEELPVADDDPLRGW